VTRVARRFKRADLFPLVIGPVDGILTALTLAAGRLLHPENPIDMSLAMRIAVATTLSSGFVFFVAEYARQRGELAHSERHLNLASAGQLALSHLGRRVLLDSLRGTLLASVTGFFGALLPLAMGAIFYGIPWMTIMVADITLGAFGVSVAYAVQGKAIYWSAALMLTGLLLSIAGAILHVA